MGAINGILMGVYAVVLARAFSQNCWKKPWINGSRHTVPERHTEDYGRHIFDRPVI